MRLLKRPELEAITGLSKTHIYDLMGRGLFPKPVKLSAKAVAWPEHEVDEWIRRRIAERDGKAA